MEAHHREGRFAGARGVGIYWQAWLPDSPPRATILIAHGAAEHSGRYAWTAGQLVRRDFAVYAVDHRGHGQSEGRRALVDRIDNAVTDLHRLAEIARGESSEAPCLVLGHSMGGAIALAYAFRYQDELAGLVLSAPLAVLETNAAARAASRVLSSVAPRLPVYKIDGTTVSRDPEVVRAYDDDPLNHRGALPARTIGELLGSVAVLPARLPALRLPILTMYGTGDRLVAPAGSMLVHERAGSSDTTLLSYDGLYHELLNEPERERVLTDVVDWIEARLP